jgi:hypothetical protein
VSLIEFLSFLSHHLNSFFLAWLSSSLLVSPVLQSIFEELDDVGLVALHCSDCETEFIVVWELAFIDFSLR